jgi:hypothetical protein
MRTHGTPSKATIPPTKLARLCHFPKASQPGVLYYIFSLAASFWQIQLLLLMF